MTRKREAASRVSLSRQWTVFGIYSRSGTGPDGRPLVGSPRSWVEALSFSDPGAMADIPPGSCLRFGADPWRTPALEALVKTPKSLTLGGVERSPKTAEAPEGKLDLATVLGKLEAGDSAYVYIPVQAKAAGVVELGFGADWWMQVWVNGERKLDTTPTGNLYAPVEFDNHRIKADLRAGENLLVVQLISGSSSSTLAAAGPAELRTREEALRRAEQTLPWKQRPPCFRVSTPELLVKAPDEG